ncbi:hypothetical protein BGT96224_3590 [Blumeria graminis f. sp. tritici 96224]|nr:hypothetical protein BGT96224_3590 [Blumeria graminis f. sp. tritici 96224]
MSWDVPALTVGQNQHWDTIPNKYDSVYITNEDAGFNGEYDRGYENNADTGFACYNCGQEGHSKIQCPEPQKARDGGGCFRCGESGHRKSECPNQPAETGFSGTCRLCGEQGHRAAVCPSKPPELCKNCQESGHQTLDCQSPRKITRDHLPSIPEEKAWEMIKMAVMAHEIDDLKEAVEIYLKSQPNLTYYQLEQAFRKQDLGAFLIATEKELAPTYTNMDFQGNLDKKYTVSWRWSSRPARPREKQIWPSSPEENMERLKDAGEPTDRGVPKCSNCNMLGHTRKSCPEETIENPDQPSVTCYNCDKIGHRVRDCPDPRPDKFACKNCKESGHSAKECPQPRSADGVECKKCNEIGHFSRDCLQNNGSDSKCFNCGQDGHRKQDCPNEAVLICRNCDGIGHLSRECPLPRDYSRVKCQNCDQMGHTRVRCTEPIKEAAPTFEDSYNLDMNNTFDGQNVDESANINGDQSWEQATNVQNYEW